ncbi:MULTISPECIES: LysR family transcriptional regulator [Micrococcales]|uniref:LysR family transcriptional regulator n=2 Tax=Micrococcales TaxID=85006 RepID=A0ABQ1S391_9MICO|nr:LysR family transcriptional regulator [Microbacterium murale]GGD91269.1 LysR family transcriptional regulator [Microbacterium murale]
MEFRQLEIFCAVAEELHFGRAARRVFLSQTSVSEQIQRLEAQLGAMLLHRSSRSVGLTPAGRVLLAEARRLLQARDRTADLVRAAGSGREGALRLATNYPASRMLLLPLLERLSVLLPGVRVTPRELPSDQQVRELVDGDLDLGFVYGPVEAPLLHTEYLLDVPVVAVVRPGHPLAGAGALHLAELPRHRYTTAHIGGMSGIEEALIAAADPVGARVRRTPSATDVTGYLLELETTDTIGFSSLPRGEQSRAQGMHLLRLDPEPRVPILAAWRTDEPLVNTVMEVVRALAEQQRGDR